MLDIEVSNMVVYWLVQIKLHLVGTMVAWTFLDQVPTICKIQHVDQAMVLQVGFDKVYQY
jgi:hypothetical protein